MAGLTSSHSRACDIEGYYPGCFSMDKRHVVGRPAIEGTLFRMIANFERSKPPEEHVEMA